MNDATLLPEQKARLKIDKLFRDAGWEIVPRDEFSPAVSAVAIEEGLLQGNLEADYLLFLEGKAVGVLEAKKEDTSLSAVVATQAENYTHKLLDWYQTWETPLPLVYLANGKELLLKNLKTPEIGYVPLSRMDTPAEMAQRAGVTSAFIRLPALPRTGLRSCQHDALLGLEASFRAGQTRALIVLATGAGKTFTACLAAYRLLTYTAARRILFLVDRNNLGKQAEGEFGTFRLTETAEPFNTIYTTERLKSSTISKDSNLVICTIQRLFSVITGQEIQEDDNDDLPKEILGEPDVELTKDKLLPPDFFDAIIVDECHRSIYGHWRKVLEYFKDARIIGLTATPAEETLKFFNNNRVANYTLEKSIADGINVDGRVYRITTQATESGGEIHSGDEYISVTKYTGETAILRESAGAPYAASDLDRAVVNPEQIRLVLETYRDAVYTELYPERDANFSYLPKTLIFAKNEAHARNIVQIIRDEVFSGQPPDFVQQITYSAGDSNELIRRFRNDKTFRIAVTVTLVATGTDVKPLEVLIFMRDLNSESLYIQMKGRGVRTIGDEQLRTVTPNAISKDLFYLIDAIGITEHAWSSTSPGGDSCNISLEKLLEQISHGYLPDDNLRLLAGRLARINAKSNETQRNKFEKLSSMTMRQMSMHIYDAIANGELDPFIYSNQPNQKRKALVVPLAHHPDARKYLLILNAGFQKILMPGEDTLISKGFSMEDAIETTIAFEHYVHENRDCIEALRIIAENKNEPIDYAMLQDLSDKLQAVNHKFRTLTLWNAYAVLQPENVTPLKTQIEREALTNIIQLVRFAFKTAPELRSLTSLAAQRFELWCGQNQRDTLSDTQRYIVNEITNYIVSNGTYTLAVMREKNIALLAKSKKEFGTLDAIGKILSSLSTFMLAA